METNKLKTETGDSCETTGVCKPVTRFNIPGCVLIQLLMLGTWLIMNWLR